jgi:uncharacterized protein DUF6559
MLRRWRSRRAAKAYVTRLGPRLRGAFGTSATYKQGQIERGIRELRLDPDYALFGYALFLDRAAFDALLGALPNRAAFEEARAALLRVLGQRPQFDASAGGAGEDFPTATAGTRMTAAAIMAVTGVAAMAAADRSAAHRAPTAAREAPVSEPGHSRRRAVSVNCC